MMNLHEGKTLPDRLTIYNTEMTIHDRNEKRQCTYCKKHGHGTAQGEYSTGDQGERPAPTGERPQEENGQPAQESNRPGHHNTGAPPTTPTKREEYQQQHRVQHEVGAATPPHATSLLQPRVQ